MNALVEVSRLLYLVLAVICSAGFATTLMIRWDELARGERILRGGLICEHLVIVYGAYVALMHHYPGGVTAPLLVVSMLVMALGFTDWLLHDLLPRYRRP